MRYSFSEIALLSLLDLFFKLGILPIQRWYVYLLLAIRVALDQHDTIPRELNLAQVVIVEVHQLNLFV